SPGISRPAVSDSSPTTSTTAPSTGSLGSSRSISMGSPSLVTGSTPPGDGVANSVSCGGTGVCDPEEPAAGEVPAELALITPHVTPTASSTAITPITIQPATPGRRARSDVPDMRTPGDGLPCAPRTHDLGSY